MYPFDPSRADAPCGHGLRERELLVDQPEEVEILRSAGSVPYELASRPFNSQNGAFLRIYVRLLRDTPCAQENASRERNGEHERLRYSRFAIILDIRVVARPWLGA
jgi:hypothetical protein